MAQNPINPGDFDWIRSDKHHELKYEYGPKKRPRNPLKGDWLKAYRMLAEHKHFSIFYRYHRLGESMEAIARDVGVDKATISRHIQRLEEDLKSAWPHLIQKQPEPEPREDDNDEGAG